MKLHQSPFSSPAFKVRTVINELAIACELVDVKMAQGEHKSPAFLAMNPNGKVPVLDDNGFYLWESNAILCYLAAKKPEVGLIPTDPRAQGLMHQWMHWQGTTFSHSINEVSMETVYLPYFPGRQKDDQRLAAGMEKVNRDLALLEKELAGKEYLCGRLSLADFSIVANMMSRTGMGLSLNAFPNVKGWVERVESRDSVRKAMPVMPAK